MVRQKGPTFAVFLLLLASLVLLGKGIFETPYCWFSGPKLVVCLTLLAFLGKLLAEKPYLGSRALFHLSAALTMLVGSHLLMPYFWAVRINNGLFLTAFLVTAGLAWLYPVLYWKQAQHTLAFRIFIYLPPVIFLGSLLSVNVFAGTLVAALVLNAYYILLGSVLIKASLEEQERWSFNGGIALILFAFFGLGMCFMTPEIAGNKVLIGITGVIILANFLFTGKRKNLKRKVEGKE
ncbi:MAG: hypothetical protein RSE47_02975 [Acidaminococcaceae bacterium]